MKVTRLTETATVGRLVDRYNVDVYYLVRHEGLDPSFQQVVKDFAQWESDRSSILTYASIIYVGQKLGETSIVHGWGWGTARVSWRGREVPNDPNGLFQSLSQGLKGTCTDICLSSSPWTNARSGQCVWRSVVDSVETSCNSLQGKLPALQGKVPAQATQVRNADSLTSHFSRTASFRDETHI